MTLADQAHFGDYWPPDFGWTGVNDPYSHPDVLVPFSHSGVSFGLMNRNVVGVFTAFLDELVPHIKSGLLDGQCGCYNPRSIAASGTRSFHSWGIACDINWQSNPMSVLNAKDPGDLPVQITHDLARKYGLEWGGDWSSPKDWMHVEVHLSPEDARAFQPPVDPLEEIMGWYDSKEEFEAAIADAVWHKKILPVGADDPVAASRILARDYATDKHDDAQDAKP